MLRFPSEAAGCGGFGLSWGCSFLWRSLDALVLSTPWSGFVVGCCLLRCCGRCCCFRCPKFLRCLFGGSSDQSSHTITWAKVITLRGSVFTDLVMFPNLPSFYLLGMAGRSLIRMLTSLWCKIEWSRCKRPFGLVCILDLLLGWFGNLPLALVWPWRFVPWGCQVSIGFPLGSSWGCHAFIGFPLRFGLRCCGFPR